MECSLAPIGLEKSPAFVVIAVRVDRLVHEETHDVRREHRANVLELELHGDGEPHEVGDEPADVENVATLRADVDLLWSGLNAPFSHSLNLTLNLNLNLRPSPSVSLLACLPTGLPA